MDINEFLKRYAAGERDFTQIDLRAASLGEVDLSQSILRNSDLSSANLKFGSLESDQRKPEQFINGNLVAG